MAHVEPRTHAEEYAVRSYEVDPSGRVSVATLCNWLQETAGIHAASLGWSVHQLGEQGMTWVLQRLRLRIDREVLWGERVRVETWPTGTQRLFALRDFRLTTSLGDPIGVATSCWVLLNVESRRPVRPPRVLDELAVAEAGRALVDDMERLPELAVPSRERSLVVRHADLDVNGHANNVSFVTWLLEALEPSDLARRLSGLDVEYRGEATRAERIISQSQCVAGDQCLFLHRVLRSSDDRELARARTMWQAGTSGGARRAHPSVASGA